GPHPRARRGRADPRRGRAALPDLLPVPVTAARAADGRLGPRARRDALDRPVDRDRLRGVAGVPADRGLDGRARDPRTGRKAAAADDLREDRRGAGDAVRPDGPDAMPPAQPPWYRASWRPTHRAPGSSATRSSSSRACRRLSSSSWSRYGLT